MPFIVELLSDDAAIVRAEACRTLVIVVSNDVRRDERSSYMQVESVTSVTAQNATFIPEYLLPQLRHLTTDSDVFVRATYARSLVRLADAAITMLEISQAAKIARPEAEASGITEVCLNVHPRR